MGEVSQRHSLYNKLKKIQQEVNLHDTTPLNLSRVMVLLETTETTFEKLESKHEIIVSVCDTTADVDVQDATYAPMAECYHDIRAKLLDIKEGLVKLQNNNQQHDTDHYDKNVKLPAIELPTFSGALNNWTSFKDLFTATIGNRKDLCDARKLQYLNSALKEEPAALISSIEVNNANYKEAWDILLQRYDNQREIIDAHLQKLFAYPSVLSESHQELQNLSNNVMECVRALKVLKCPTEHWDHVLVYFTVHKLDSRTKREWAVRLTGTTPPSFNQLMEFLQNHIRGLKASGAGSTKPVQPGRRLAAHHVASSSSSSSTTSTFEPKCPNCKAAHFLRKCPDFLAITPQERSEMARKLHLCGNCLKKKDHRINDCKSILCTKCGNPHHTLLHFGTKNNGQGDNTTPPPTNFVATHHVGADLDSRVLLSTAIVRVRTAFNGYQHVRILLDSGSEGTLITEDCVRLLGLKRHTSNVHVTGVGATTIGKSRGLVTCTLLSRVNNFSINVEAYILPRVAGLVPRELVAIEWAHLSNLPLADPTYHVPGKIDILLGADFTALIQQQGRKFSRFPNQGWTVATQTQFGWAITGRVNSTTASSTTTINSNTVELDAILRRFWEIEELPLQPLLTDEEKECERVFVERVHRDSTGRYVVPIPFNGKQLSLGSSKPTAVRRLLQVEKRLQKHPEHRQAYNDFMDEYLRLGHMERIPPHLAREIPGKTYYLPHHFVLNISSTTTKFRVVFDGSCKTDTGLSLNDTMLVGATIQDDLFNILLRFRSYKVVLKADVTKMFRQFKLSPEDADYHRIVWRRSPNDPFIDCRLTTVSYGTACASFVSTRAVKQLSMDVAITYPQASRALKEDIYVDDAMTGARNTEAAIELYNELTQATDSGKLELRKWASNDPAVLAEIPEELREVDPQSFDKESSIKALGVHWNPSQDTFGFTNFEFEPISKLTKRILPSQLARVFDPLGFLAAVTIRAKIIMQGLWRLQINWDEELPEEYQQQWKDYMGDLEHVRELRIPRFITHSSAVTYELHGFCDASEIAYGGIVYLRSSLPDGSHFVSMVTSKAKVSPIRQITLARLELCGAVLLANLLQTVQDALRINCKLFAWSDSTIALRWIATHPRRWKTFIANRVAEIQGLVPPECWHHVPGVENPADLISRGIPAEGLSLNEFYWKGPTWLSQQHLPIFPTIPIPNDVDMEERAVVLQANITQFDLSLIEHYSSLTKLKRVTAFCLRFINNSRTTRKLNGSLNPLTGVELRNALGLLIRLVQKAEFAAEMADLSMSKPISKSSKLSQLHPYLDNKGLLRVGGRLQNAAVPEQRKHQLILPKSSHLTELIISYFHLSHLHGGFQLTYSALSTEYWIIGGRDVVRYFVRKCVVCRRRHAAAATQLMGQLPISRVNPARPFINTGVDYAGPFNLKNMRGRSTTTYKGYLCVFICMATKAVHLEAVSELSTGAFIATFRRFAARRGMCHNIYSDCGTNFVGADRELQRLINSQQHQHEVSDATSANGVTWHFNAPSSPHHGGLWESAVKSAKFHLRRVMGEAFFTFEQFQTVLAQVEAVLNSRPLTPMSSDPTDLNVLTPAHFLIGEPLMAAPDENLLEVRENRLGIWQRQQQRVQHFWRRWQNEYLHTLQQRQKWRTESRNFVVGDMVIIKEDNLPPGQWKIGRITEVHTGEDGQTRVVTVKTANSLMKRPIVKLIPLFYSENES